MEDYSSVIWHKFIRLFDCKSTSFFRYTQIFRDFLQKTWFLFVVRRRFTRKKLQENALCLHSRCYNPIKQNEEILQLFPHFDLFFHLSRLQNYYISSDPPNHSAYFLQLPPIFCIKPIFPPQKKAVTRLKSFCFGLPATCRSSYQNKRLSTNCH